MARKRRRLHQENPDSRQPADSSWSPDRADLTALLAAAAVTSCRPIMWGSNGTFLVTLEAQGDAGRSHAVYKPRRGESPLWDFPRGTLYRREMATYLVSEALGWPLVPPIVVRDGPYGVGSVQLFIEHDPDDYFTSPAGRDPLAAEQIALLDIVLNNADRKAEHCLRALDGHTWAIDHGLTFHTDPKLRTVIWEFAGQPIPADLLVDLETLYRQMDSCEVVHTALKGLVSEAEIDALRHRLRLLVRGGVHPDPGARRRAIPWGGW